MANVYMQSKHGSIYLPPPDFDDKIALGNKVIINRSMSGAVFSFVRRTKFQQITMSFSSLTRDKVQELARFYLDSAKDPITLVNHNNDRFVGFLTVEPLSYVQNRANVNQVEITFEGILH